MADLPIVPMMRIGKHQLRPLLTPPLLSNLPTQTNPPRIMRGGERGPVTFPAFKAGDAFLRGTSGGFDFHTPPPTSSFYDLVCVSVVASRNFLQFCCNELA